MAVVGWNSNMKSSGWAIITTKADLVAGDTTEALELPNYPEKTIEIRLVSGTLTDLDLQGSNEGVTFYDLHRLHDGASTFSNLVASLLAGLAENPRFLKVTAVAGTSPVVRITINAFTGR